MSKEFDPEVDRAAHCRDRLSPAQQVAPDLLAGALRRRFTPGCTGSTAGLAALRPFHHCSPQRGQYWLVTRSRVLPAGDDAGNTGGDRGGEYPSGGDEQVGEPLLQTVRVEGVLLAEVDDGKQEIQGVGDGVEVRR